VLADSSQAQEWKLLAACRTGRGCALCGCGDAVRPFPVFDEPGYLIPAMSPRAFIQTYYLFILLVGR
jgi:hypothetical protein